MMSKHEMRKLKTSDIFKMSKILKKMDIKMQVEAGSSLEQAGVQFIQTLLENLHLAEKEVSEFMADLIGITPQEFANLDLAETMEVMKKFSQQEDISAFLKLAGK